MVWLIQVAWFYVRYLLYMTSGYLIGGVVDPGAMVLCSLLTIL